MTRLRSRIHDGDELLGTFLQMGSSVAAEIAGLAGFDWVLIDLEHGAGSEGDLLPQLMALAGSEVEAVVRVESASRLRIGRVLDLGASGIMAPQVNSAESAAQFVEWCQYPPQGSRGVALSARAARYGRLGHDVVGALNESVIRVAQIETRAALEGVDSIAAVDGLDVLFVGPSDLSHSLGIPGQFQHPSFQSALETISAAAIRHGRATGVHLPNIGELVRYRTLGFTLISIASDSTGLTAAFTSAINAAAPLGSGPQRRSTK